MSKMGSEFIREADARATDDAFEVAELRAEVARLEGVVARAAGALESISAADLDEMDGSLGWAYSAMFIRKALASLKGAGA